MAVSFPGTTSKRFAVLANEPLQDLAARCKRAEVEAREIEVEALEHDNLIRQWTLRLRCFRSVTLG